MNDSADWQQELSTYMEANTVSDGNSAEFYDTCVRPLILLQHYTQQSG